MDCSGLKVGDQVFISALASHTCRASSVERWVTVTATGPSWFNADGLCFRKDGTQLGGHYQVHGIIPKDMETTAESLVVRVDKFLRAYRLGRPASRL